MGKKDQYSFEPPRRGLSFEEAIDYALAGLDACEQECLENADGADVDKAMGWLMFCAEQFLDEPYGRVLANECERLAYGMMPESRQAEVTAELERRIESRDIGQLSKFASALIDAGNPKAAYRATACAIEEAEKILAEAKDRSDGKPVKSFTHFIHVVLYGIFDDPDETGYCWCDPDVTRAFFTHGTVLYELGEYSNALKFFEQAHELNPRSPKILMEMAECYKRLRDMDAVAACARQALECAWDIDDVAKAHRDLGYALVETGHYRWATAHYRVAEDYSPSPISRSELEYIAGSGYNIDSIPLDEALRITKAEPHGLPVSDMVAEAGRALVASMDEIENIVHREVLHLQMAAWSRGYRDDMRAAMQVAA